MFAFAFVPARALFWLLGLLGASLVPLEGSTLAERQREKSGEAFVYLNFAINCHDWVGPDLSSAVVLRAARFLAKHGLKADFYATGPLYRVWEQDATGTIEELNELGMGLGYHHRPPHPTFYNHSRLREIIEMNPEDAFRTFERLESEELDLQTGETIPSRPGGFRGTQKRAGRPPLVLGAGTAPPHLMAIDRQVLRMMGARSVVAFHSQGAQEYPLVWWQGLLARPSDFSIVRVPMNSRQRAAKKNVLPRGVGAGEESGSFWWNAINDSESQEHRPAKYLERRMTQMPADRITYITSLIHEDDWYKIGSSFNAIYYHDRTRRRTRTPPFDIEGTPGAPRKKKADTEKIWQWWEELVEFAARDPRVRVVTTADLLEMLRSDLERTFDRDILEAAAKDLVDVESFPPEFLVVSTTEGEEALSLSDAVQAITRAIADDSDAGEFAVRTMLGPIRARGSRAPAPATLRGFDVSAADVRIAARRLSSQLDQRGRPDALPDSVEIAGRERPLESYLFAAARVLLGERGEFSVPELARAPSDPAQWTIKPAQRR